VDGMGWMGWDGRLSPSASLLRAPYGANNAFVNLFGTGNAIILHLMH